MLFLYFIQVALRANNKPVKKADIVIDEELLNAVPIVTEKVKKAIKNLCEDVVLDSLWQTQKHTDNYSAGIFTNHTPYYIPHHNPHYSPLTALYYKEQMQMKVGIAFLRHPHQLAVDVRLF